MSSTASGSFTGATRTCARQNGGSRTPGQTATWLMAFSCVSHSRALYNANSNVTRVTGGSYDGSWALQVVPGQLPQAQPT